MVFHGDFLGEMVHFRGIFKLLVTKVISADERFPAILDGVNETRKKETR